MNCNYKNTADSSQQSMSSDEQNPKSALIQQSSFKNSPAEPNYMLIDDACALVAQSAKDFDLIGLLNAIKILHSFLKEQKVLNLPKSFIDFDVVKILKAVVKNEENKFDEKIICESIMSLSYIFKSRQGAAVYLSPDFIVDICNIIRANVFISIFGYLIEFLRIFVDFDVSLFVPINNIIPIPFLVDLSLFSNLNSSKMEIISLYFFDFFSSEINVGQFEEVSQMSLFKFAKFCYDEKKRSAFSSNLWSIESLLENAKGGFMLSQFLVFNLNAFVFSSILKNNVKIIEPALFIILHLYSHFQFDEEGDSNFENLIMIPLHREKLPDSIKAVSIAAIEKVLSRHNEKIGKIFEYDLPNYLISTFCDLSFDIKNAICSLFVFLIPLLDLSIVETLVDSGLIGIYADFLVTESKTLFTLQGLKTLIDKILPSEKFVMYLILFQNESFVSTLTNYAASNDAEVAELAALILKMTGNDDDMETDGLY